MADPSEIQHTEELLRYHLMEWRDAGGSVESVSGAILRLIVARERFAEAVRTCGECESAAPCTNQYGICSRHGGRPNTTETSAGMMKHTVMCACGESATSKIENGEMSFSPMAGWHFSVETGWRCPKCAALNRTGVQK